MMTQLFSSRLNDISNLMLCYYTNGTGKTLIARITNIPNWRFERIIFPQERLFFEAPSQAKLELHHNGETAMSLIDSIPCSYLKVQEQMSQVQETLWHQIA
ncbi:MAG: DUF1830 domain-containing protein [Coleofasciculus sp. G1-WW12-02]|uniref:DUF1830 domain-containing protein n=1 Tax=Coleofasciculus sp. G1-WW12-02 TaxID=3068483 RepID=UPI0032F46BF4